MKNQKFIKILAAIIVLFMFGCGQNYKVKTIIYTDGSCLRILKTHYDSPQNEDFFEWDHPIPMDTTWSLVIEKDTTVNGKGDTLYLHTATKFFENVGQINQLYANDSGMYGILERTVSLNKSFRWFYTFLDYIETYGKLFEQPSLYNYMDSVQYHYAMLNNEEQQKYLTENFDSIGAKLFDNEVEIGFLKWIENTIIFSSFNAIQESAKNIEDWPMSESEFLNKKDSIIRLMDKQVDLFDGDENVFEAVKRVFGLDSLLYKRLTKEEPFDNFIDKYKYWEERFTEEDYINTVEMPGLILETNSKTLTENNEVEWTVEWMKYFTDDYEMHVQSRIVNKWAFWVSGIIVVLLALVLVLRRSAKTSTK